MTLPTASPPRLTAGSSEWPTSDPWWDRLNRALPQRLYSTHLVTDLQQLCVVARSLLCAHPPRLPTLCVSPPLSAVSSEQRQDARPRLERALAALLDSPLWPDLLATHPELLPAALPLLHLRQRLGWNNPDAALEPLHRALRAGYIEDNEWTSMYLLDLSVHLGALGLPCPLSPEQALARTVLHARAPSWIWCFEKVSVLHHLLRSAAAGRLPLPDHWHTATHAHLLNAIHGSDLRALSDYALAHAILPGPDLWLLQLALQQGEELYSADPDPVVAVPATGAIERWSPCVGTANLHVVALRVNHLHMENGPSGSVTGGSA